MNILKKDGWLIFGQLLFLVVVIILARVDMLSLFDTIAVVLMAMPIIAYGRSNHNWLGCLLSWSAFMFIMRIPVCEWFVANGEVAKLPITIDFWLYKNITGMTVVAGMLIWVAFISWFSMMSVGMFMKGKNDSLRMHDYLILRRHNNFVSCTVVAYVIVCAAGIWFYQLKVYAINIMILAVISWVFYLAYSLYRRAAVKDLDKRISSEANS